VDSVGIAWGFDCAAGSVLALDADSGALLASTTSGLANTCSGGTVNNPNVPVVANDGRVLVSWPNGRL
jgi:hypothetical protein